MKKTFWFGAHCLFTVAAIAGFSGNASANNVAARVEGSLLVVAGDNLANQIVISRNAAGDVLVTGQNGTRVNGKASERFPRLQLNAAEILMGGGNDVLTLRGLQIANDLFVNLGDGADRLVSPIAAPVTVGANFTVEGAAGNDTIRTEGLLAGQDYFIDGGIGVLNATVISSTVGYNVTVIGDNANDVVTLTDVAAGGDISAETKGGSDRVTMTSITSLSLAINTDANAPIGVDRVSLMDIATLEDIGIFTGPGNDIVQMADVASGKNIVVSADTGNDTVSGTSVSAQYDAVFEGGDGTDRFEDYGITGGEKLEIKEFEVFVP